MLLLIFILFNTKRMMKQYYNLLVWCFCLFFTCSCGEDNTDPISENKYYTLNFAGEGVDIEPQLIEYGNHATAPENPERESYDFGGWFIDNGTFANEWDFETDVVTQDTTFYAKWELIKICNIDNPLTDLPWLKEYCESLKERQDIVTVSIDLYRAIDNEGYVFQIYFTHTIEYAPDEWTTGYSKVWRDCTGKIIYSVNYPGIHMPPDSQEGLEKFLKSIEFVAQLYDYVMPICGVNAPLQNIKWLKEYCENLKERQDISSVRIDLYKSKDEYAFQIWTFFPYEYAPNIWTEYFSSVWKNCAGETIFPMFLGESPPFELREEYLEFLKDKNKVVELFHFVRQ